MRRNLMIAAILAAAAVGAYANSPAGPEPLTDDSFPEINEPLADLGHLLFFDPVLSGNLNIACATCHHPTLTNDVLYLLVDLRSVIFNLENV